ncbi:MAG: adenosylcobinamide kinase [Lachnospiraceae bacterium]|jgi:adenosylcobinamide kinase/adenosylcobinamide-phosphate guanylyltransferase|nr:adenosylcobinamide kinase [Lachnospiraceae bacterium]
MLYMVTGGCGSGKSEYAESLIMASGAARKYYVATMEVYGREERLKVERHRKLRDGKGFVTIESPKNLGGIFLDQEEKNRSGSIVPTSQRAVLVECVSNLAANELFRDTGTAKKESGFPDSFDIRKKVFHQVMDGILKLKSQCGLLVLVTNEVCSDGIDYGTETGTYIRLLGEINCSLAKLAHRTIEVVYGIPLLLGAENPIAGISKAGADISGRV